MFSSVSPRMQDYLEAVLDLEREDAPLRVTELAERLGVTKASASVGLKKLAAERLLVHERYGRVELTDEGRRIAASVCARHRLLEHFLAGVLGVDPEQAAEDACGIEHHISRQSRKRLEHFIRFIRVCPRTDRGWLEHFRCSYSHGEGQLRDSECREDCLERCLEEVQGSQRGSWQPGGAACRRNDG